MKVEEAKQQAEQLYTEKVGEVQQQAEQVVRQVKSQASVAVRQAEQQVELVKQEAARLIEEGVRLKETETGKKFADRIRQTELQMQTMEDHFQVRINMERTEQQQKHIDGQEKELQFMKDQAKKLKSVKLQRSDQVQQVITDFEERSEAAKKRIQDLEIKAMRLGNENTAKTDVAPPEPPGDPDDGDDDPLGPDLFSEGSYHGHDEEDSEEESALSPSGPEPPLQYR